MNKLCRNVLPGYKLNLIHKLVWPTKPIISQSIYSKPNVCGYRKLALQNVISKKVFINSKNIMTLTKTAGAALSAALAISYLQRDTFILEAASKTSGKLLKEADLLYDELKFDEIYNLLITEKDSNDDEILWRLARATYEKSRKTDNSETKKALLAEALQYLEEANKGNENNFAVHKWMAIIMDCYYTLEGMKSRISHLYDMKTHMEKACALKPMDGTSWYVLGMWYFGIANISWYERKAAAIFFATPPQATYEEALQVFLEAEKVEPNFYSKNHLMIGKCLYYLGRKEEAKDYFFRAKSTLGKTLDDEESRTEAEKWL